MPNIKSAEKRVRQTERRRVRNHSVKSEVKTSIGKAEKLIVSGEMESAKKAVTTAVSFLDKAKLKGIIHANNASRHKARLAKKLNQALTKPAAEPETPKTK